MRAFGCGLIAFFLALAPATRAQAPAPLPEPGPPEFAPWLADTDRLRTTPVEPSLRNVTLAEACAWFEARTGMPFAVSNSLRQELDRRSLTQSGTDDSRITLVVPERSAWQTLEIVAEGFPAPWTWTDGGVTFVTQEEFQGLRSLPRPTQDIEALSRLRVRIRAHWEGAAMHTFRPAEMIDAGHAPPSRLRIVGRLGFLAEDGSEVPLSWAQSIGVVLARDPDSTPDWSAGIDRRDSLELPGEVRRDGTVQVDLEPWQIGRVPGKRRAFQIGFYLPDLEAGGALRDARELLPRCTTKLEIDGPPVLSSVQAAINGCSAGNQATFDPVGLVRAVNRLRSLPKDEAITELRRYVALTPQVLAQDPRPIATNLDTGDSNNVFLIVHALFVPDPGSEYPTFYSRGMMGARHVAEESRSTTYPLVFVDDLPFLGAEWIFGQGGHDSDPLTEIEWAVQHASMRSEDLHPTDDPIAAAEEFAARPNLPRGNDPRAQVWRALESVVGMPVGGSTTSTEDTRTHGRYEVPAAIELTAADWDRFKAAVAELGGVHWDAGLQQYVAGPRKR